jgi:L-seryl-tRNA(Ser) seleniumtransferase
VGTGDHAGLRSLPAVHELAASLDAPHTLAVAAAREAIDERRSALRAGLEPVQSLPERARAIVARRQRPSLRRVLNATGVVIHTNLGRAPLSTPARAAVARAAEGYSNLELDLASGTRGSRQAHVESLLAELTGAEAAMAVNNGAAAVLLSVAALAGAGRRVIVSRGQLVEIGGGFRIPEVVAQSGAKLIEVGTTNRTRIEDYARVLNGADGDGAVILRVHPSNFRTVGFVEETSIEALCRLGVPVIDDAGSGVLTDTVGIPALATEPTLRRSVAAGAALVCCSADKLLGGPQAGLLVGRSQSVAAARDHPLARALRIDKLSLAALEATLALLREPARGRREIPVLAMLDLDSTTLEDRARRLRSAIGPGAEVVQATGRVGGGALPLLELEGPAVALTGRADPVAVMEALRLGDPPVIARISDGRVLLDPRTLRDDELPLVAAAVRAVPA